MAASEKSKSGFDKRLIKYKHTNPRIILKDRILAYAPDALLRNFERNKTKAYKERTAGIIKTPKLTRNSASQYTGRRTPAICCKC
ncbi:unnamed protein product, partial [Allacma fusca]